MLSHVAIRTLLALKYNFLLFLTVYIGKTDENHRMDIVVVLCWYMVLAFKVTSGYISHLLIKPPIMEWLLLGASWCLFSQQHRKNTVLPWSLTLLSTSIPSVDCWCLFLSIWLSLVWYENPASSSFSWSRAIHTVCDFQLPICSLWYLKSVPDQQSTKRLICFGCAAEHFCIILLFK